MSITTKDGCTVATGAGISYIRLASLKGMVKLESKGLRGRGGAIRPRIAAEFSLNPRASYQTFIVAIQSQMDRLLHEAQQELANEQQKNPYEFQIPPSPICVRKHGAGKNHCASSAGN